MILLDTSVLIDSLTGPGRSAQALRAAIAEGRRIRLPTLVLYEWLRGPRLPEELQAQEALFPSAETIAFGPLEATRAAQIYSEIDRPNGREIAIALAATAIEREASIWTLNDRDFADIPGLDFYSA